MILLICVLSTLTSKTIIGYDEIRAKDFMGFRNAKLGDSHPKWFKRIPELYRFKGLMRETEASKQAEKGSNNRGKVYELNSLLFPLLVVTIGERDDLIADMFRYVVKLGNVTIYRLRIVRLLHPFLLLRTFIACY